MLRLHHATQLSSTDELCRVGRCELNRRQSARVWSRGSNRGNLRSDQQANVVAAVLSRCRCKLRPNIIEKLINSHATHMGQPRTELYPVGYRTRIWVMTQCALAAVSPWPIGRGADPTDIQYVSLNILNMFSFEAVRQPQTHCVDNAVYSARRRRDACNSTVP